MSDACFAISPGPLYLFHSEYTNFYSPTFVPSCIDFCTTASASSACIRLLILVNVALSTHLNPSFHSEQRTLNCIHETSLQMELFIITIYFSQYLFLFSLTQLCANKVIWMIAKTDGRRWMLQRATGGRVDACSQRPMSYLCAVSINKNYCLRILPTA